jgi:hypothetical protein
VFDFGGAEVEQCVLWRKCGRRKILRDSETTLTDPRRRKRTCRCRGWLLHRAAGVSGLLRVLSLSHAPAVVVSLDRARAVITATEVLHPARPVRRVAPDDRHLQAPGRFHCRRSCLPRRVESWPFLVERGRRGQALGSGEGGPAV